MTFKSDDLQNDSKGSDPAIEPSASVSHPVIHDPYKLGYDSRNHEIKWIFEYSEFKVNVLATLQVFLC